jgi:hypothetical protein
MWTLLAIAALVSMAFGLIAVGFSDPLTDKDRGYHLEHDLQALNLAHDLSLESRR